MPAYNESCIKILEIIQKLEKFQHYSAILKSKTNEVQFFVHVPETLKSKGVIASLQLFHSMRSAILNNNVMHYIQY